MKKILMRLMLMSAGIGITQNLPAQNWQIAKHAGGAQTDFSYKIVVDHQGNVFTTGLYGQTAGGITYFDTDTVYCFNFSNYFLAKYDSSGNLSWVKTGGGSVGSAYINNWGSSLKTDTAGNVYVIGVFCGTASFGGIQLTSYGNNDVFIAKFNPAGNCLWAKEAGGGGYDVGTDIVLDNSDNIYITGWFNFNAHFDNIILNGSSTGNRMFLAKYDNNGNCVWANTTGGFAQGESYGNSIINITDKIFLCGAADSASTFGNINISSAGGLIAEYDTSGFCNWVKIIGRSAVGNSISHDSLGNLYLTGIYNDTTTFDSITLICRAATWDAFISKCDLHGNFLWAKNLNSNLEANGAEIITNNSGESYITGYFRDSASFGNFDRVSVGTSDIFLTKYDSNGNCIGVMQSGNPGSYNIGSGVAVTNNSCYITGDFEGTNNFGAISLSSYGGWDIFWAKTDDITKADSSTKHSNNLFSIYPNPNQGKCTVTIPDDFLNEGNILLSVYDNIGKLIHQKTIVQDEGKIKLNLEKEAKGIYYVLLSNGKKNYSGKIVKE
jgi:hypothetical protein